MSALVTAADAALPVGAVFARGGEVLTNSVTVAQVFGRQHKNVLRDIEVLLSTGSDLSPSNWFRQSAYRDAKGEDRPAYDLTRDGLSLLVMGFTGAKAMKFKVAFIEAFNRMEAELRARPAVDPLAVLNDPAAMRGLLLGYTEQVLALQADKAALVPKAEALDRISAADGSFCLTDAAKALQMRPKDLVAHLQQRGWIYRRPGCEAWRGYQSRVASGHLEHKIHVQERPGGTVRVREQVRITAKGLAKLAELLGAGERAEGVAA